jgi:hypothetical protein
MRTEPSVRLSAQDRRCQAVGRWNLAYSCRSRRSELTPPISGVPDDRPGADRELRLDPALAMSVGRTLARARERGLARETRSVRAWGRMRSPCPVQASAWRLEPVRAPGNVDDAETLLSVVIPDRRCGCD